MKRPGAPAPSNHGHTPFTPYIPPKKSMQPLTTSQREHFTGLRLWRRTPPWTIPAGFKGIDRRTTFIKPGSNSQESYYHSVNTNNINTIKDSSKYKLKTFINSKQAWSAGCRADPSRCNSTSMQNQPIQQNPPIQQNCHNLWTNTAI